MSDLPAPDLSVSDKGMVASASPRAAAAGLDVLRRGGNAFDAALATAAMEWLTLPGSCGLGGDTFAVLYDARSGRVAALNGSGVAGSRASLGRYRSEGLTKMPLEGWHAAAVPGTPDACATLARTFGTVPFERLLAPAIDAAEQGVAVSPSMHRAIAGAAKKLARFPESAAAYLPAGRPPGIGERWVARDTARTLRALAEGGPDAFYRGAVAEEIVRVSEAAGGPFAREDFAAHATDTYEPLHTRYRDVDVYETALPSQGLIVLEWLNLLAGDDLSAMGFGSADAVHLLVEAKKLAFADRIRYCGDPRFVDVPVDLLLSADYAAERRSKIDPARADNDPAPGRLPERPGDTSSFVAADGDGNAISFIHSLSAGFGSGVVAGGTGVLLNNRAGRGFALDEGHPNAIAPGRKTVHTLNAYLLCRAGRPFLVGGTPGGDRQVQWNVQAITHLVDFGMDIAEAVRAPSWISWPGADPAAVDTPLELRLESRFSPGTFDALERRGHRLLRWGPWDAGSRHQLISCGENGTLYGATDPRCSGVALGW